MHESELASGTAPASPRQLRPRRRLLQHQRPPRSTLTLGRTGLLVPPRTVSPRPSQSAKLQLGLVEEVGGHAVLTAFRRQLWLLMRPSLRDNRRVRAFVDLVAEALREGDAR